MGGIPKILQGTFFLLLDVRTSPADISPPVRRATVVANAGQVSQAAAGLFATLLRTTGMTFGPSAGE